MRVSKEGLEFITAMEGLRLRPYLCSAGVPTIGVGHTGSDITMKMKPITKAIALVYLANDIKYAERTVTRSIKVKLTQKMFDALTSLVFNIGSGNFRSSTLRMKLNRADYIGCANEFWKWRRASGKISRGLVYRRRKEVEMFMEDFSNI